MYIELPFKTSVSDPLRIDFFSPETLGVAHRVGLSMHPGRRDTGLSAVWSRDLQEDFSVIWATGVRTIVCTVEPHEFHLLGISNYIADAEKFGFSVLWFPIRDVSVPISFGQILRVCKEILTALQQGDVLIHCRGGKGRTGTVAVCLLAVLGFSAKEALRLTRKVRTGTVETREQERWCFDFERFLSCQKKR